MQFDSVDKLVNDSIFFKFNKFCGLADLFVKVEGMNAGGSIKMKTAIALISDAIKSKGLYKTKRFIESSSGNLGLSLSIIAAVKGLHNLPRKVDLFNKTWQADAFPEFYQALLTDGAGGQLRQQLYSRQMALQLAEENSVAQVRSYSDELTRRPDPFSAAMEYDFNHWMQEAQMVKVDIASMANSLEVRVPFLDKQVVGLGSSLPARFKLHASKEKYLLHCLAKRYLPDYIVNRKKQELAVPLEQWMVSSMKMHIIDTLTSEQALSRGYFNPDKLRQFVREFYAGHSYVLWTMYMLEKWHQQFVDNQEP